MKQLTTIGITALIVIGLAVAVYFGFFNKTVEKPVGETVEQTQQAIPLTDVVPAIIVWEDDNNFVRRTDGEYIRSGTGHKAGDQYVYDTVMRVMIRVIQAGDTTIIDNSKVLTITQR